MSHLGILVEIIILRTWGRPAKLLDAALPCVSTVEHLLNEVLLFLRLVYLLGLGGL